MGGGRAGSRAAVSTYLRPQGLFLPLTERDLLLSCSCWAGSWLEEAALIAWGGSHKFTGLLTHLTVVTGDRTVGWGQGLG